MKRCGNCKNRCHTGWFGTELCLDYEMTVSEEQEIQTAASCAEYEEGTPSCLSKDSDERYISSSTAGDYSPSSPWDAPGMTTKDFIK